MVKSLRNSSPDAFTENELEALASDLLKRAKVERGELALHNIGPAFIKRYELEGVEESLGRKLNSDDLELIFFPELTQPVDRADDLQTTLGITKGGLFDGLVKAKPTIQELARFTWPDHHSQCSTMSTKLNNTTDKKYHRRDDAPGQRNKKYQRGCGQGLEP